MDGYSQHLDEQSTIKRESRGQSDVVFAPFHVSAVLCRLSLSVGMSSSSSGPLVFRRLEMRLGGFGGERAGEEQNWRRGDQGSKRPLF